MNENYNFVLYYVLLIYSAIVMPMAIVCFKLHHYLFILSATITIFTFIKIIKTIKKRMEIN